MVTRMLDAARGVAVDHLSRSEFANAQTVVKVDSIKVPSIADSQITTSDTVIVIIDRRVLIRDCLVRCLKEADGHCAVLAFASVAEWLETASRYVPALILLSIQVRNLNDLEISRDLSLLSSNGVSVPVVIMSDAEDADRVVAVLKCGARGYIPTSVSLNVAVEAMRLVEAGGTFAPASSLISSKISGVPDGMSSGHQQDHFTTRQRAVLIALRKGKANKQIAYELNMREGTVKVHVRHIMKKLKARNRTEVAIFANGLFSNGNGDE